MRKSLFKIQTNKKQLQCVPVYKITAAETAAFWCPKSLSWTPSKTDRRRPRRTPSAVLVLSRSRPVRRSSPVSLLRPSSWNDEIIWSFRDFDNSNTRVGPTYVETRLYACNREIHARLPNRFARNRLSMPFDYDGYDFYHSRKRSRSSTFYNSENILSICWTVL